MKKELELIKVRLNIMSYNRNEQVNLRKVNRKKQVNYFLIAEKRRANKSKRKQRRGKV